MIRLPVVTRRSLFSVLPAALRAAAPRRILLRSGWQTENIGDIAHTPGLLRLLEFHLPSTEVTLWSNATGHGVAEMLRKRFPKLTVVSGEPGEPQIRSVFAASDFFLHGSGPGIVARAHLQAWRDEARKPYGVFGVTVTAVSEAASAALDDRLRALLDGASFVFTRETVSLKNLNAAGVRAPLDFAPDATFALDLANEPAASEILWRYGLEQNRFLCAVPRLRYTPYHKFRQTNWSPEEIRRREAVNEQHAEPDHAKLRMVLIRWVRESRRPVLLCPEMSYELDLFRPLILDPLPADVRRLTFALPRYWITDTAASVYRRAAAVVSFECHSPIIAASQGTPGIYLHQPEDGIKGHMWTDVGLGGNCFEIDAASADSITARLLSLTREELRAPMAFVAETLRKRMSVLSGI